MKQYEVCIAGYFIQTEYVTAENKEDAKINALRKIGLSDCSNIKIGIKEVENEKELSLYIEKKDKDVKVYEVNISGNFTQSEFLSAENEEDAKNEALSMLDLEDLYNVSISVIEIEDED